VAAKLFNRVASLRVASGLTQSELAARIQVSPETVAAIENGRQDATLLTALRMSRALRTEVPNIFREQPFPKLIGSERGESRTA
jgi:putative transcriptional regulator|tara:strand:- start:5038 stop:5289 length:252 start_codon:yes stop_codon:yes gene_type:complete